MSFPSRRDFLRLVGAALPVSVLGRLAPPTPSSVPVLYRGSSFYPRIAITYDDCDLVTRLHMLQDSLTENPDVRITLFPVGRALVNNEVKEPGLWKWFHSRGHEFGYHSWDHTDPYVLSDGEELADYDRWQAALYDVLDDDPSVRFARPPFGNLSRSFLNMCALRAKVPTMWSTGFGGAIDVGVRASQEARNGDIALMHTRNQPAIPEIRQEESWDMTITAKILPELRDRGMQCVTLSRLYDDWIREGQNSAGCEVGAGDSPLRSCLD
jgi:peptidoglycan/xylan/chitin deacetylase (PgdA/CDA1 family)